MDHSPKNRLDNFRQRAIYDLCRRLFADPSRLVDVFSHPVRNVVTFQPHTHRRHLQFCLMVRCTGNIVLVNERTSIQEATAMLAYPRQVHGYALHPMDNNASVHVLKLRVEPACPFSHQRVYPALTTGLSTPAEVMDLFFMISRHWSVNKEATPLLLARATEILTLWPTGRRTKAHPHSRALQAASSEIARAMELIDESDTPPPNVETLAEAANLSPRHFTRRFRREMGVSPQKYITAYRLDRARQLLLSQQLAIHEVAETMGFPSLAAFSRWFHHYAGVTPSAFVSDPSVH